jgi:7-cyano-7-deazaguanine synthase in queuosine biosynthesis
MVNMITKGKEKATGKMVLLFSGGMDSVIFDHLLKPDVLLYLPTGSKYEDIETKKLLDLTSKGYVDGNKLVVLPDVLNLNKFERDDAIVPNRNAFLLLFASLYGEILILGSVQGDRSYDKDEIFYDKMMALLNHMWQEQHWTEEKTFKVISPYKNTTKTQLIKDYLADGGSFEVLLESYSCYTGDEQPCGWCKPCFRKWVALHNNNIPIGTKTYQNNPWEAPWLPELLPSILECTYRGMEDVDWCTALRDKGKI